MKVMLTHLHSVMVGFNFISTSERDPFSTGRDVHFIDYDGYNGVERAKEITQSNGGVHDVNKSKLLRQLRPNTRCTLDVYYKKSTDQHMVLYSKSYVKGANKDILYLYAVFILLADKFPQEFNTFIAESIKEFIIPRLDCPDNIDMPEDLYNVYINTLDDIQRTKFINSGTFKSMFSDTIRMKNRIQTYTDRLKEAYIEVANINEQLTACKRALYDRQVEGDKLVDTFKQLFTSDLRNNYKAMTVPTGAASAIAMHTSSWMTFTDSLDNFVAPLKVRRYSHPLNGHAGAYAVFKMLHDNKLRLKCGAHISVHVTKNGSYTVGSVYAGDGMPDAISYIKIAGVIPNIHITHYDCWEEAKAQFTAYMSEHNYYTAFEFLPYAAATINPYDVPVITRIVSIFDKLVRFPSMVEGTYIGARTDTGEPITAKDLSTYFMEIYGNNHIDYYLHDIGNESGSDEDAEN